jgi:PPK2 family polyphosphate:nucleotide phosphotransferase
VKISVKHLEAWADECVVPPGKSISLKNYDPGFKPSGLKKEDMKAAVEQGIKALAEEQDKLYAQNQYALLVVLQAMDAAGKDGTIKHVMSGVNPQGCQVSSFKAPSVTELDHDYLWRCARALPERGCIGIFNRSYYEEVLIAKVHPEVLDAQQLPPDLKDKGIWKRRYEEINNFEKYLVNNGIIVLKFFLNVSKEEQQRRFLERIELPDKNWKFSASDARERLRWGDYHQAYEDCFNSTSTKWAPWYVIPADHKPFTRLLVGYVIYETLVKLKLKYPAVTKNQKEQLVQAKEILLSE